jgi:ABC-2 type transport system permease protein
MTRALRVEWLKLRSARGTWILLALAIFAAGLAAAGTSARASEADLATVTGQRGIAHTAGSGAIFVLVLAILSVTNEFRYGSIVLTTLADPQRVATVAAKAVIAAIAGVAVGVASVGANIAVGSAMLASRGYSYQIGHKEIWSTFVGSVLAAVVFAVLGVAIGSAVRKGPAAIIGALAWLLVLEALVGQVITGLRPYLPGAADQAIARVPDGYLLTMWQGGLVAAGYLVVAAIIALGVTRHRDV